MRLRTRLFVAFALIAILPVGIVGYFLRDYFVKKIQSHREANERVIATFVQRDVEQRLEALQKEVEPMCEAERAVDQILQDLHEGVFDARERAAVQEALPEILRRRRLDVLEIVGAGDRVLASSDPDRVGRRRRRAFRRAVEGRRRTWVEARTVEGTEQPIVLASCVAEEYERTRVAVVGGKTLLRLVPERKAESALLFLYDGRGRLLAGNPPEGVDLGAHERVPILEADPGGPSLVVYISETRLRNDLARLDLVLGALSIAALLVAGLLSALLANRITRPLSDLAAGAQAVAGGDLDVRIGVQTGGEIGELVRAFNRMTTDLADTRNRVIRAERIAAWREIARRIAHEIKNPLSPIQTSIETLRKAKRKKLPEFDEIFEESADTILEEVQRLKRIVTEFSRFARMPRPRPEPVEVRDLLSHAVGLHAGGDVPVTLAELPPLPTIRADREQLTQVLVNLLQNAIDAVRGRPGGRVEVSAAPEPDGEGAVIVVRDTGAGIPADALARIFEPYYTTKPEGTGLGLAIAHRIVTDHAGRIDVSSEPGEGTTVRVSLPREGPPAAGESDPGV